MYVRACVHTQAMDGSPPHAMEGRYKAMQAFRYTQPLHVILFLFDVKCRQLPQAKEGKKCVAEAMEVKCLLNRQMQVLTLIVCLNI